MNAVQQNRVSGIPALAILLGFRRVHVRPDPNNSEGWAILAVAGETELELAGSLVRVNTTNFSSSDLLFVVRDQQLNSFSRRRLPDGAGEQSPQER